MKKSQIIVIILAVAALLAYFFVPSVKGFSNQSITAMKSVNLEDTIAFIRSYGSIDAVVSIFLLLLTWLISQIPAFFNTYSKAPNFCWVK